jgi:hypothetical protein
VIPIVERNAGSRARAPYSVVVIVVPVPTQRPVAGRPAPCRAPGTGMAPPPPPPRADASSWSIESYLGKVGDAGALVSARVGLLYQRDLHRHPSWAHQ